MALTVIAYYSCAYALQWHKHVDVLSHYNSTFVTHLIVAIMRHGTYYETPTENLQFAFLTAFYYGVTN